MVKGRYKETEIGIIPLDWDVAIFGDKVKIYRGGSPRPITNYLTTSNAGVNWIKIGDVKSGEKYINKTEEKIIPEGVSKSREVFSGDFILSNSMSFGRPYILNIDGCIHDGWLTIQSYNEFFDKEYLYYLLSSDMVFAQYISMAAGSSVKNLNKDKVSSLIVSIPAKCEQQKIAESLSNMDNLISSLEKLIEKKKAIKQGAMQELLTGKKRLPGFCGEIEYKPIKVLCEIFADGDWIESKDQSSDGIRLIQTGNIGVGKYLDKDDKQRFISEDTFKKLNCLEIFENDVLVSRLPEPAGRACILPSSSKRRITAVDCTIIRFTNYNPVLFVAYSQTKEYRNNVDMAMAGSTRQRISRKELGEIPIPVFPTNEEQNAVASIFSNMDTEITALEQKLAKCQKIKQGMMQQLLMGKIRLV